MNNSDGDRQQDKKDEDKKDEDKKGWQNSGLMNYSDRDTQTVVKFLGIELTAPASLKNPGIIYASFIIVNVILFFVLRNLVAG